MNDFRDALHFLANLAMDLEKKGCHLFFRYSPHVKMISWEIYLKGWKEGSEENIPDYQGVIYEDCEDISSKFSPRIQLCKILEIIEVI